MGLVKLWVVSVGLCAAPHAALGGDRSEGLGDGGPRYALASLPIRFEENRGQTADPVAFVARGRGNSLFLTPAEVVLVLVEPGPVERGLALLESGARAAPRRSAVLRLRFPDASPAVTVLGEGELPGRSNHYRGSDPARWRTGVPAFARVRYADLAPGVDLVLRGDGGELELLVEAAAGADPASVAFEVVGADGLHLDAEGGLLLPTALGPLRLSAPAARAGWGEESRPLDCRFALDGARVRFELGAHDPSQPVVIDPVITFSGASVLNGTGSDILWDLDINVPTPSFSERLYVTGYTTSTDFPTLEPIPGGGANAGGTDVFIANLDVGLGTLLYATYLGGSGTDLGYAITSDGPAYVTGLTTSTDFPIVDPFLVIGSGATYGGGSADAFAIKLEPYDEMTMTAGVVEYSRYVGGSGTDAGYGIAVFTQEVYLTGTTDSTDFPIANPLVCGPCPGGCPAPFDGGLFHGAFDAFVTKLGVQAGIPFSTYLGDAGYDIGAAVVARAEDPALVRLHVAGGTTGPDFPTTCTAYQPAYLGGDHDVFLYKLTLSTAVGGPTLASLDYATFLGGSGDDGANSDVDVAVDPLGRAHVAFTTGSLDVPTLGAPQPAFAGGATDGFVLALDAPGLALVHGTYLGGTDSDNVLRIDVDRCCSAHVAGYTRSDDFPVVLPVYGGPVFNTDGVAARLDALGQTLLFSTYLGAVSEEVLGHAVAADFAGNTLVGGYRFYSFPVATTDTFLARLSDVNTPVGSNVCASPLDPGSGTAPVTVTFASVSAGGTTTLAIASGGPSPPGPFTVCDPALVYDLATSAAWAGPIQVCVDYSGVCEGPGEPLLKLFHYQGGTWVDVTTSVDPENDRICGVASSLSPFAVFRRKLFRPISR